MRYFLKSINKHFSDNLLFYLVFERYVIPGGEPDSKHDEDTK